MAGNSALALLKTEGPAAIGRFIQNSIQAKFAVSPANDRLEREAECVADVVVRSRPAEADESQAAAPLLPLSPAGKGESGTFDMPPFRVVNALAGASHPLEESVCSAMEAHFGHDFSRVRVHSDTQAAESARALNALAYTTGRDMVFGAGKYAPETSEGRRLLAHELAHVVQQSNGNHSIQRQEAAASPRGPSPGKDKLTGAAATHPVDVVFVSSSNRWLVSISGIPVAEISVKNKETPLDVYVDIAGSAATVTLRHYGDAALAAVTDPGASLDLSVSMREIDMRKGAPGRAGPTPPPVAGEAAAGTADIVIAPPGTLHWPDEPMGELSVTAPSPPGTLSEFEDEVRANPGLINGVVLDPDDPNEIIGYRVPATTGLTRLVDREGDIVFQHEAELETPPVDPIDLIPTPGSVFKTGGGIMGRLGVKALGKKGAAKGTKVALGVIARMRGVSKAIAGRAVRKGITETPGFVRKITQDALIQTFDKHAAEWFGRVVSRETHYAAWRQLVEQVAVSKQIFAWSTGAAKTIAHLGRVEGKYFVVQFYEETGELATAFVPRPHQLRAMLKVLRRTP